MTRTRWVVGAGAAFLLVGARVAAQSSSQDGMGSSGGSSGGTSTMQQGGTYDEKSLRTLTLTVKSADPAKHKVTFEATVKPEATTSSGQPIKIDQLKEGDTIRASFDPKTGDVVRLDITPAPSKTK